MTVYAVQGNYTPSDKTQTYVYQLALLLRDGRTWLAWRL
jgi:hypothetical protein